MTRAEESFRMTGAELRSAREALRISRNELAQALGVTGGAISQWQAMREIPGGRAEEVRQALSRLSSAAPGGFDATLPALPTQSLLEEASRRSLTADAAEVFLSEVPTFVLLAELGRRTDPPVANRTP